MPVSTILASQELLRPSHKSLSPCDIFSANEEGVAASQGILTADFKAGPVHCSLATHPVVVGRRGMFTCSSLCQGLRGTPDSMVSDIKEVSKALGSGLNLYTLW
jgi:hypothetical protein